MDKDKIAVIAAQIAASYVRRELDRSFYDQLMLTPLGQRLIHLSDKQKYAFEFISYSIAALTLNQKSNPGAIRTFINSVLSDAPAEIASRMINSIPEWNPMNVASTLNDISDNELIMIANIQNTRTPQDFNTENTSSQEKPQTYVGRLADQINARRKLRKSRKY